MEWKEGDWCIFELSVGQIKRIGECEEFSDGLLITSGKLSDRFRPLTLRNKGIVACFDWYYKSLRELDGEGGFNYPDIFRHFADLSVRAIDGSDDDKEPLVMAQEFVREAREHKLTIQGVRLHRPNFRKVG